MNRFTFTRNRLLRFFLLTLDGFFPFAFQAFNTMLRFPKAVVVFIMEYRAYRRLSHLDPEYPLKLLNIFPCPYDRYQEAGSMPRHYFRQDLWGAKKVYASGVQTHYDIGSRLDGFIAHCLPFCRIVMIDIRPLSYQIENMEFVQADATNLHTIPNESIASISSLHAVDDFGAGHYSSHLDPLAYRKAIAEIQRVTQKDGNIYFSVPIGEPRLVFSAGHIFNPTSIEQYFDCCTLVDWAAVDDDDHYYERPDLKKFIDYQHACGFFHFRKNDHI